MKPSTENRVYGAVAAFFAISFTWHFLTFDSLFHSEGWNKVWYYGTSRGQGVTAELSKIVNPCIGDSQFHLPPPREAYDAEGRLTARAMENYRGRSCDSRVRETNNLFELIDAKAVLILNRLFPFGAKSVSHLLFTLLTALLVAAALFRELPDLPRPFLLALSAFLCVTPSFLVFNTVYYRPAKTIAALAVGWLYFLFVYSSRSSSREKPSWALWLAGVASITLLELSDEQAVAMVGFFLMLFLWRRGPRDRRMAGMLVGAVACYLAFRQWVEPALSLHLEGVEINRGYQAGGAVFQLRRHILGHTLLTFFYLMQSMFSDPIEAGISSFLGVSLGAAAIWLGVAKREDRGALRLPALSLSPASRVGVGLLLILVMGAILYLSGVRHPPVVGLDLDGFTPEYPDVVRGGYYYLPMTTAFWLAFVLLVAETKAFSTPRLRVAIVLLLALVGSANLTVAKRVIQISRERHSSFDLAEHGKARRWLSGGSLESKIYEHPFYGFAMFFYRQTGRSL
jgi:hypothetical protein